MKKILFLMLFFSSCYAQSEEEFTPKPSFYDTGTLRRVYVGQKTSPQP